MGGNRWTLRKPTRISRGKLRNSTLTARPNEKEGDVWGITTLHSPLIHCNYKTQWRTSACVCVYIERLWGVNWGSLLCCCHSSRPAGKRHTHTHSPMCHDISGIPPTQHTHTHSITNWHHHQPRSQPWRHTNKKNNSIHTHRETETEERRRKQEKSTVLHIFIFKMNIQWCPRILRLFYFSIN